MTSNPPPTPPIVPSQNPGGIVSTGLPGAIRRFSDSGIQASIDKVLKTMPEGKNVSAIAVVRVDGVSLVAMAKIGKDWSVMGVMNSDYKGHFDGEAAIMWSH